MPVYVIGTNPPDLVKIGWARNAERRLIDLQTGSPLPLVLLGSGEGDLSRERQLHRRFAAFRVQGEWFRLKHEELDYALDVVRTGRRIDLEGFPREKTPPGNPLVQCRVTEEVEELINAEAARRGMTRSDWMRMVLTRAVEPRRTLPSDPYTKLIR